MRRSILGEEGYSTGVKIKLFKSSMKRSNPGDDNLLAFNPGGGGILLALSLNFLNPPCEVLILGGGYSTDLKPKNIINPP